MNRKCFQNCDQVWNVAYFDFRMCLTVLNRVNDLNLEDWMRLDKNKGSLIKRRGMNIDPLT